jgi:uncharacterized protein (DUF983 family)
MNGNICPQCGKPVMTYKRFSREAEPFKISKCDNCGTSLRRSRKVYLYLLLMMIPLCAICLPVFITLTKARTSFWIEFPVLVGIVAAWTVLTNYLAWRLIGWDLLPASKKT